MFGLDDAISAGSRVLDKFIPDPAAKAQAEAALRDSLQQWDAQQNKINEVEAQSSSLFVAGWRPCVGWVCCAALSWTYILQPIAAFALAQFGYLTALPRLDMGEMMPILLGMLGLGGLRSWEKTKGVAAK
jgi:hypothetical protein